MIHSTHDEPWTQRRRMLRAGAMAVAALAALSLGRRTHAARDGAMRILCSGPAGSIPDLVARAIGEQLPATLGQHAVVDNRPGAAGQLSVAALKNAPADGSTLLLAQGAIATVYPFLYARLGYDAAVDLQPVSLASEMALGLAVGPGGALGGGHAPGLHRLGAKAPDRREHRLTRNRHAASSPGSHAVP